MEKELGLYIHIPFCVSKCHYCNFVSATNKNHLMADYLKCLLKEIEKYSSLAKDYIVTTIYIGGGTPSCFVGGGIKLILDTIKSNYAVTENAEISIEANPNSITEEKVKEWIESGVNRVSIGLQSGDDKLLKIINRPHTKKDYLTAIKLLKKYKIKNFSTDIMLGLPSQTIKDVKNTVKLVLKTKAKHISAYSLILEEGTKLYSMVNNNEVELPTEDESVKFYDYIIKKLKSKKINRYEVSNFAQKGYECIHNLNCWKMVEYLGFGVAANSYFNNTRWGNIEDIEKYISKTNKNLSLKQFTEKDTVDDKFNEYIMLKLRTTEGIDLNYIQQNFNIDLYANKKPEIDNMLTNKLITVKNNHISATNTGFKVLNQIILELVC